MKLSDEEKNRYSANLLPQIPVWLINPTFSYAISTVTNPRRLEGPFYMVWMLVLINAILLAVCGISVAPQFPISYTPPEDESLNEPPKRNNRATKNSKSEDLSVQTVTGRPDYQRIPDFTFLALGVLHKRGRNKSKSWLSPDTFTDFLTWPSKVLTHGSPVGFGEAKRPPPRLVDVQERKLYNKLLDAHMSAAQSNLEDDAALAFLAYERTQEYVLMAIVAQFFCWKIAKREQYHDPNSNPGSGSKAWPDSSDSDSNDSDYIDSTEPESDDDDDDDDDDNELKKMMISKALNRNNNAKAREKKAGKGKKKAEQGENKKPTDRQKARASYNRPYPTKMQKLHDVAEDAWPQGEDWSGFIELGTEQASQQFYLIQTKMKTLKDDLYAHARGS